MVYDPNFVVDLALKDHATSCNPESQMLENNVAQAVDVTKETVAATVRQ